LSGFILILVFGQIGFEYLINIQRKSKLYKPDWKKYKIDQTRLSMGPANATLEYHPAEIPAQSPKARSPVCNKKSQG
jgi:hypothetical protein